MAQLVVRNLENNVKTGLQRRAKQHGRSMEEEVRDILRNAARENGPAGNLGTEISALFSKTGLQSKIPELRGYSVDPTSFEE
jgi:antitoxin FitA